MRGTGDTSDSCGLQSARLEMGHNCAQLNWTCKYAKRDASRIKRAMFLYSRFLGIKALAMVWTVRPLQGALDVRYPIFNLEDCHDN